MVVVKPPVGPHGSPSNITTNGDFHLVIKGFRLINTNIEALNLGIDQFLTDIYRPEPRIPVKCGRYIVTEDSVREKRVLRLSFVVRDGIDWSLDAALQSFCNRIFDHSATHGDYDGLSFFGMYGFSPEEERMKYFWYRAMFNWMNTHNKDALEVLQSNLNRPGWFSEPNIPFWVGAGVFAASLGATRYLTPGCPYLGKGLDGAAMLLGTIAGHKEKRAHDAAPNARTKAVRFMEALETVIEQLNEIPTAEKPQMLIHRNSVNNIIALFEAGADAITCCRETAHYFLAAQQYYGFGALTTMLATGVFTIKVAASVSGPVTAGAIARQFQSPMVRLSLAGFTVSMVGQAWGWWMTKKEKEKWEGVVVYIAAGMKISHMTEVYVRWTYNSGETQGNNSLEYRNAVREMAKQMEMSLPEPDQCTPENVGARLKQHAETLREVKHKTSTLLGIV